MIPAAHAVRSALVLKLLGKARRSHVMDLLFDEGVALAVGLNALPKATFMSQYSSRLGRTGDRAPVGRVGRAASRRARDRCQRRSTSTSTRSPTSATMPSSRSTTCPRRSQRRQAVLAFLAQDAESQVFCYANADLRKGEEADEVLRFVSFWEQRYGERPRHLVFDSKLTTYANLSKLNALGITFITLRRRSPTLQAAVATLPALGVADGRAGGAAPQVQDPARRRPAGHPAGLRRHGAAALDPRPGPRRTHHPAHQRSDTLAQAAHHPLRPADAHRERPRRQRRLLPPRRPRPRRWRSNVDFDVLLTVIASGIYRLFAKSLRGYERAQARQLFRRFLDTTARVTIAEEGSPCTCRVAPTTPPARRRADRRPRPRSPGGQGAPLRIEIV